ncbi:hypothetical protein I79_009929 [Cricetulus griseus]|uniref:Uncharacterized protein n=1 Tax=Cricetulus griseus TaxID=10029 RepID=G3HH33_CRIGR|nr:hypothetical protein I79_009929 [Cricetulus griseus]
MDQSELKNTLLDHPNSKTGIYTSKLGNNSTSAPFTLKTTIFTKNKTLQRKEQM